MSTQVKKETMDKMVDAVLEYNKTPRRHLFEYPYRADDSQRLIANAERLVKTILALEKSGA